MPTTDAPPISTAMLVFFRRIVRRYFRRQFRAVRVSHPERFAEASGPLLVYANHSSWWDPMVAFLLADALMPGRAHYAPMDADALARYGILRRVGVFPVAMESSRGAAQFLRTGLAVLRGGGVLWVTPQGRFADARERPLAFKPGLAALATRLESGCTVLPLAIEYVFWNERLPEALLHFGKPVYVQGGVASELDTELRTALAGAMDDLRTKAMTRDAAGFTLLEDGVVGAGGFYEFGQRLVARMRGKPYEAAHTGPAAGRPVE